MNLFLTIITGVFVAIIAFYFKSCMQLAQNQKIAALRFQAYLLYWQKWVLDNNLFDVYYMGVEWNKEIIKLLKDDSEVNDFIMLENEKREIIKKIKDAIDQKDPKFDKKAFLDQLAKLPQDSITLILEESSKMKQNIIEGRTFLTDQEAAILGELVVGRTIELKMHILSAMDKLIFIMYNYLHDPEEYDICNSSNEISEAIWDGIIISKYIDSLTKDIQMFSRMSLVQLTKANFFKEL